MKIFGAKSWHDTVSIIGNKEALLKLRDTIDSAIKNGYFSNEFMETDGEGFEVEIKLHDEDFNSDKWDKLPNHYSDEIASTKNLDHWNNLWELMKPDRREGKIDKLGKLD